MTPSVRTVRIRDWRALERQIVINGRPPRRFVELDRKDQASVVARIAGQEFRKAEDGRKAMTKGRE